MPETTPGRRDDREPLLDKLRRLVAHPATAEAVRNVARDKLTILAPRNPNPVPGSPRRRAADALAETRAVIEQLVDAAWVGVDKSEVQRSARSALAEKRFAQATRQQKHILDILT